MKLSLNSLLGKKMHEMLIFRETAGLSTGIYFSHFKSLNRYCSKNYPTESHLTKEHLI